MRRRLKDMQIQVAAQSGLPASRLFSMFVMLVVICMIFVRMRDSNTWRWLGDKSANPKMVIGKNGLPEPVGNSAQLLEAGVGGSSSGSQSEAKPSEAAVPLAASPAPSSAAPTPATSPASTSSPPAATPAPTASSDRPNMPFVPSGSDSTAAQAVVVEQNKGSPSPSLPSATGPTDEDPEEREFFDEARLAIKDGREHTTPAEMPAYAHILAWVEHQPLERLSARAKKDVPYDRFMFETDSMRFKLVEVTLNVRQIVVEPYKSSDGTPFYELHGFSADSGQLLYFGIVAGLPQGMPVGVINEQVRLIGYFYKKQGYQSQASITKAKHLEAPLIVGRIVWLKDDTAAWNTSFPPWLVAAISVMGCLVVGGWVLFARRITKPLTLPPLRISNRVEDEGPSVDDWLDQAQSGRLDGESEGRDGREDQKNQENGPSDAVLGNIFGVKGESNSGHGRSDPDVAEN